MTVWLGSEWDRGYRAGREEGMKELRKDLVAALNRRRDEIRINTDQAAVIDKIIEEETSWLD